MAEPNPYSTLPAAGNRMWERSYLVNIANGESEKSAAIHAWMHIKKFYRQDPVTKKWTKRKKAERKKAERKKALPSKTKNPSMQSLVRRALS